MKKLENLSKNVYFFFSSVPGGEVFHWRPIHWITTLHCDLCKYCCVILACIPYNQCIVFCFLGQILFILRRDDMTIYDHSL